ASSILVVATSLICLCSPVEEALWSPTAARRSTPWARSPATELAVCAPAGLGRDRSYVWRPPDLVSAEISRARIVSNSGGWLEVAVRRAAGAAEGWINRRGRGRSRR